MDSRELDRRKTLQVTMPAKPANDNDEFEKQRTAAIAEVAKSKEVRKLNYNKFFLVLVIMFYLDYLYLLLSFHIW